MSGKDTRRLLARERAAVSGGHRCRCFFCTGERKGKAGKMKPADRRRAPRPGGE